MVAIAALDARIDLTGDGDFLDANENVSSYVNGRGTLVSIQRGANFDGSASAPGSLTLVLANQDNRFTPYSASVLAGLKAGRQIRIQTTYASVTYPLFHGWIRRIVPRPDGYCEIFAEDALYRFTRKKAAVPLSLSRSINGFRTALLDAAGEVAARRNLSDAGLESTMSPTATYSDNRILKNVLDELNTAVGSIHFIRPMISTTDPYNYVTVDRTVLQGQASSETWAVSTTVGGLDMIDEALVNQQTVSARPRRQSTTEVELWVLGETLNLAPAEERVIWAVWSDPLITPAPSGANIGGLTPTRLGNPSANTRYAIVATGSPTVLVEFFAETAKITITAGGSPSVVSDLRLYGYPVVVVDFGSAVKDDLTSQADVGIYTDSGIDSEWIPSLADAEGLASYVLWRYSGTPRARPTVVRTGTDYYPSIFVREPGDRVSINVGKLNLTAFQALIESVALKMQAGGLWSAEYGVVNVPAAVDIVTIGGTAAQGVGGTAILGY